MATQMRPRDSQRSKLYRWEASALGLHDCELLGLAECQMLADGVCRAYETEPFVSATAEGTRTPLTTRGATGW